MVVIVAVLVVVGVLEIIARVVVVVGGETGVIV